MTDQQSGPSAGGEQPPQDDQPQPRKRTHRRATRPATGGDPTADVPPRPGRDDTDAGWAPDAPDSNDTPRKNKRDKSDADREESAQDRWWREQRPPHWG
ncbi:hypothetical protein GCM10011492_39540 [Flexivirga endophytica]|uniref:Uncharacterized protein n=1 Tax=Flexivirga endophytica TaxID=1849103 RepID=A0A916TGV6_9MICO|nr:hypothetical protein [Flexivirga endophytica]GGB44551.1 hypothetical protein GCM10011492_39540 [Flexivirga endophytica]GHB60433.1 hypothetical protein GCM10008112_31740 [Flexivirga endophytica]